MSVALREYQLQNYNRPLDSLLRGDIILDPAYQRGSVWTEEQRRNLVLSVLQGLPIGAIFLNERDAFTMVAVDGKQRIETLLAFTADDFAIPRAWVPEEHVTTGIGGADGAPWIVYSQTSEAWQRGFRNFAVASYETHFRGKEAEEQERELFNRINFGGTPHAAPEAEASYKGVTARVSVRDDELAEGRLRVSLSVDPPESLPGGLDPLELYSVTVRA